jgi:hypothetical protein
MFASVQTPFILHRLKGGRYENIGAAYMHGAMYGELIERRLGNRYT